MAKRCDMCDKPRHDTQYSQILKMSLCGFCYFEALENIDEVEVFNEYGNEVFDYTR